MIRKLLLILLIGGHAQADDALEKYRTPIDSLNEKMVGTASRSVRFDWRNSPWGFAFRAGQLLELNNFSSTRYSLSARKPVGGWLLDFGASWVHTQGSTSSDLLALTPYRQAGRPSRLELELNLGFPLFEGVATPRWSFIPTTEWVMSVVGGARYLYYPGQNKSWSEAGSLASPFLTQQEVENLESHRLPGMLIDRTRWNVLLGTSFDIYFSQGLFITTRAMVSLPVFSAISGALDGSSVNWFWDIGLGLGWHF